MAKPGWVGCKHDGPESRKQQAVCEAFLSEKWAVHSRAFALNALASGVGITESNQFDNDISYNPKYLMNEHERFLWYACRIMLWQPGGMTIIEDFS